MKPVPEDDPIGAIRGILVALGCVIGFAAVTALLRYGPRLIEAVQ